MQKFLTAYLLITGIGAFVALAMPSLVVLGFFLLILPGLLLSLAPTAFLYGCIFAASWWLLRIALGDALATVAAGIVTAAILFAIPSPSRQAGQKLLEATVLPDVASKAPIRPVGDIRLDLTNPRWDNKNLAAGQKVRAFSCDNLCVALLFTPGVTSVTVNSSAKFSPEQHRDGWGALVEGARTFRLLSKAQCGDRGIDADLEGRTGLFGRNLDEMRAVAAEWNLKLATDFCIVADAPISRFDLQIYHGRYQFPEGKPRSVSAWSLQNAPAQVTQVAIRDAGGTVLLRRLISRVSVLARPFNISGSGAIENFRFHWGRQTLSNARQYAELDLLKILEKETTLGAYAPATDLVPQIRQRLQEALADPERTGKDPVFATLETYFDGIKGERLDEEDLALITALILDERLTSYRGLWQLKSLAPEQHRRIGDAIVRRVLQTSDANSLRQAHLSDFLGNSPPDAFAKLSEDEGMLVHSPERRVALPGLVMRLSDGGAANVPLILDILKHHASAYSEARGSKEKATDRARKMDMHSPLISAARIALCRLGPVAASALPELERMIADGTISSYFVEGHGGTDWQFVLLRMGKPLDTIGKPDRLSGTMASHRDRLQQKLDRFDPNKSCGHL